MLQIWFVLTIQQSVWKLQKKKIMKFSKYFRDTAGKKKFEPTSKLFLKGTQGVIFCFDLTSKESLKKIQNWVQKLEENFEG